MRRPRLELPGVPLHVTQRGVDRAAVFLDDEDCAGYLQAIATAAGHNDVAIHAYVLMTNHVHLLVSADATGAVSRMMQAVGRRYVRAFNTRHGRSGTLWEGRYKSCLVDSGRYLLACLRYIELNPVRAAMVQWPWEYRWSSVHPHLGLRRNSRLTPHSGYLALGPVPKSGVRFTYSIAADDLAGRCAAWMPAKRCKKWGQVHFSVAVVRPRGLTN